MLWNLYLRSVTVYLPTVAQTDAGFYLDLEPVQVVSVADTPALRRAIQQTLASGNPRVPSPSRGKFPKPVVLKYANVKSWAIFERSTLYWKVVEKDGIYQIIPGRRAQTGGWEDDPIAKGLLPADIAIAEVAARLAPLVQMAAGARRDQL